MISTIKQIVPILLALAMCGCSNNASTDRGINNSTSRKSGSLADNTENTDNKDINNNATVGNSSTGTHESNYTVESGDIIEQRETLSPKTFPRELEEIPREYLNKENEQGMLVDLNYTTYEFFSYAEKSQEPRKRAVVYLLYGYNEQEKYNVFYLMHGGWSNETTTLGTPEEPAAMKNVLDNAITDGKIPPLIVVCPTYNNTSGQTNSI